METTISVLVLVVALMGFPCRSIPNTDYTAYGTYNTYGGGGGSHSPYPGYPQGGPNYPFPGSNYPFPGYPNGGSNYPFPGLPHNGGDLNLPEGCDFFTCYVPACQVESCRNFPQARCVGFCGGCVARFFVGRVNVTPFCGGSTPPGTPHHKKY
nr:uncharacterized protein LOC105339763 isoform X2 [Crassostrea gigas]XP_034319147.1 uncharacterized protein LOC105339763 isoform X4 [Crassostrea gigas]